MEARILAISDVVESMSICRVTVRRKIKGLPGMRHESVFPE
jgi:hypothetical protein